MKLLHIRYIVPLICLLLTGCGLLKERTPQSDIQMEIAEKAVSHPLTPEQTESMMGDIASNWFYGQGVGETMLAVGTVVVFPPYAIYLAGNAILSLSGYQEVRISQALPESGEDIWNSVYDGVTSVPGQMTASVAGREYVSKNVAEDTLKSYFKENLDSSNKQQIVKSWR